MTMAPPDLITGYLAELSAGLRVPPDEAELILAEAEDHLCETAAAGMAVGMTELEAQQAAISSFGPVRAVVRAHHRRPVTAGDAALAAWKLTGLLAVTAGVGGLAAVYVLHSTLVWAMGVRFVQDGPGACQCSMSAVPITSPAMQALPFAAMAAGGLALLAARKVAARRLARPGIPGRDVLSPTVTASFFLAVTALLLVLNVTGVGAVAQVGYWMSPLSSGTNSATFPFVPGGILAACLAVACGYGLQTALRRARRGPGSGAPAAPGRDPLPPAVAAGCFLLATALLFVLNVSGAGGVIHQAWIGIPISTSGSSTTTIPLVPGPVLAGCLAVAVGFGVQAVVRLARRGPGSGVPALSRSRSG